jgi:hypothetical protein
VVGMVEVVVEVGGGAVVVVVVVGGTAVLYEMTTEPLPPLRLVAVGMTAL